MANMKHHVYLLTRYAVDFDIDEKTHRRLGVFATNEDANKAKTRDILKCLNDDCVPLSNAIKTEVMKAATGKTYGCLTSDGFYVTEDEIYDNDDTHVAPKYSWEIEKVPKK